MSALSHLASLLSPGLRVGERAMSASPAIDEVLARMKAQPRGNGLPKVSEDQQLDAVRRFWPRQDIPSFRDAYLLSWGLCLPHRPLGPSVLDDRPRLQKVLEGADRWMVRPSAFRRCYQGLVRSYFTYDFEADSVPASTRANWKLLRDYLRDRNSKISDKQLNPDWVETAIGNKQLFGENPCPPYVDALLKGDATGINHLCSQLGIVESSWFLRELVLAQILKATKLSNAEFEGLMPRLLDLLRSNTILRDRGLILILDRYARIAGHALHQLLRDMSVLWWGNPWLPSNETRWGGVAAEARSMVSDWLKLEFIETFFTKLADDGLADPRRMNFWKRYVKAIGHIEFALGSTARYSDEPDFVLLREKMKGLICHLDASGTNNAFIMTMGHLVAVEFSSMGNAFYGYDARQSVPFDTSKFLRLTGGGNNSLKQKAKAILWMSHQDGIRGWDTWEEMFEATLRSRFDLEQGDALPQASPLPAPKAKIARTPPPPPLDAAWKAALDATQAYSVRALNELAAQRGFQTEDKTSRGGSLWAYVGAHDPVVAERLTRWGFQYKLNKGWWK